MYLIRATSQLLNSAEDARAELLEVIKHVIVYSYTVQKVGVGFFESCSIISFEYIYILMLSDVPTLLFVISVK